MRENKIITIGGECRGLRVPTRTNLCATEGLVIDQYKGPCERTFSAAIELAPNYFGIAFNGGGVALLRSVTDSRWHVVAPNSVVFAREGRRLIVRMAKGEHDWTVVLWGHDRFSNFRGWMDSLGRESNINSSRSPFLIASLKPTFESAIHRIQSGLKLGGAAVEPLVMSGLTEAVTQIYLNHSTTSLVPRGIEFPESISNLVLDVSKAPQGDWSLKNASEHAGYSPFHFSRLFKQIAGIGFHEFVDRFRTEVAVEAMCASSEPIELVAENSGFGTVQSLRESIKEYLGLVPSDLRNEPSPELIG